MTTLDARALLTAILAHPDDDTPRLMYADCLEGLDTVSVPCTQCAEAVMTPCHVCGGIGTIEDLPCAHCDAYGVLTYRPNCAACEGAGFVLDTSAQDRAEFIRVQCEWERLKSVSHPNTDEGRAETVRILALDARARILLSQYRRVWLAGECSQCGDTGWLPYTQHSDKSQNRICSECYGGLLRAGCEVTFRRGWPYRVTVPEIRWLVEEESRTCTRCHGVGGETHRYEWYVCDECGGAGQLPQTVPSRWLRRVLSADVARGLIAEVVPACRVPHYPVPGEVAMWAHNERTQIPGEPCCLPAFLWELLDGHREKRPGVYKRYRTPELAVAALGRTFAKWGRSA